MPHNQAIKYAHFVRRTSFHSAAYGRRYNDKEPCINSEKKKLALWLGVFLAGFVVVGLGIMIGVSSQTNSNFVSTFALDESRYTVETTLSPAGSRYYIVASIRGSTRASSVVSAVIDIQGDDQNRSTILEAGDSRSVNCAGIGFCKELILEHFYVEMNTAYELSVGDFNTVGQVEILGLTLHSNHSRALQAVSVLSGLFLIVAGMLMSISRLVAIGYNKALQRTSR